MFCSHCGKEVSNEAYVCTYCGCLVKDKKPEQKTLGTQSNVMAMLGVIFAFFFPILGFVFGAIGIAKAKEFNGVGEKMANLAISISLVMTILFITLCVSIGLGY